MWTSSGLDREVFTQSVRDGCDRFIAVCGAASPQVLFSLLAREELSRIRIDLTLGMVGERGLPLADHLAFRALQRDYYPERMRVRYLMSGQPVHAAAYVWCTGGEPKRAFIGTAQLTHEGFHGAYLEALLGADATAILKTVTALSEAAHACDDASIPPDMIVLNPGSTSTVRGVMARYRPWVGTISEYVDVSLMSDRTKSGVAYGLNWGLRPGRDPNQSYLPVPASVSHGGFLPPRGRRFTLISHTGSALSVVVAQDGGKAIESPDSNALLGLFIRSEFGLPAGALISALTLQTAGVTGYRLYRLDCESYAIEFGPFG